MFKAIGTVIVLWYLATLFTQSVTALDNALAASFRAIETAAAVSRIKLEQ